MIRGGGGGGGETYNKTNTDTELTKWQDSNRTDETNTRTVQT